LAPDQPPATGHIARHGAKNDVRGLDAAKEGSPRNSIGDRAGPRDTLKTFILLALGAASIIVAHNHPSGIATPSPEDHDHVIVARDAYSFAERGELR
jgi:hypothetical protein